MKVHSTGMRRRIFLSIFILSAVILVYAKTVSFDLVYCDDNIYVVENYAYNSDTANVFTSFKKTLGATFYRPFLSISFILDAQIGELDPKVYHTTNLVLHLAASLLLFFILLKSGFSEILSCLLSLFFSVHPLLTPAVSWIPGRNDSLLSVFVFVSLLSLIHYLESRKRTSLVLHVFFFAVSLFTKETAILFPVLCVLFIRFFRRERLLIKANIPLIAGWITASVLWWIMRSAAMADIINPDTIGLGAFLQNYPAFAAILGKIFIPVKMCVLASFESLSILCGVFSLITLLSLLFFIKKIDKGKAWFGLVWFVLFLLPAVLVRIANVDDFFDYAEHRAYLPLVGIIFLLAEIFRALKIDFRRPLLLAFALVVIGVFAARSFTYTGHFKNRRAYWSHQVKTFPEKSKGYYNLGKVNFLEDRMEEAESLYKEGIRLNPQNPGLYFDLAAVYLSQKKFQEAEQNANKALSIEPQNSIALYYLGKSFMERNLWEKAVPALERASEGSQVFPYLFLDLGKVYAHERQFDKALKAFKKAIDLNSKFSDAYLEMGNVYFLRKEFIDAERVWIKSFRLIQKCIPLM